MTLAKSSRFHRQRPALGPARSVAACEISKPSETILSVLICFSCSGRQYFSWRRIKRIGSELLSENLFGSLLSKFASRRESAFSVCSLSQAQTYFLKDSRAYSV